MISITSYSGGGKTTIAKAFAKRYQLPIAHFDEIDQLIIEPSDFQAWLKGGANFEAYGLEKMQEHIALFRQQHPDNPIIFDYPFGKLHTAFRNEIGLAIFIDTPLDVAMARRLIRDMPMIPTRTTDWLEHELSGYLDYGRQGYLEMARQIMPTCDLVLDGLKSTEALVEAIAESAKQRSLI